MKKIAVVFGGKSPEHKISVRSAKNVVAALDRNQYDLCFIGIDQQGVWRLVDIDAVAEVVKPEGRVISLVPGMKDPIVLQDSAEALKGIDLLYLILHGPNGEDGTVQGLARMLNIPFIGPDVLGSSVAMDKDYSKRLLAAAGVNVAPGIVVANFEKPNLDYSKISKELGTPMFIKPANMGSSVGVHKVEDETTFWAALEDAFLYDHKVLIEQMIEGRELECAVMGNDFPKASTIGEVITPEEYSYEEKYSSESSTEVKIPADLPAETAKALQEVAKKAYRALRCEVLSRVDMFLADSGEIYVNEINTLPGFTSISMYPQLWAYEGYTYSELIDQLITYAIERHTAHKALKTDW